MNKNILGIFTILFVVLFFNFGCFCNKTTQKEPNYNSKSLEKIDLNKSIKATVALSIIENEEQVFYCAGIFVSPTIIITARHCVVDKIFYQFKEFVFPNEDSSILSKEIVLSTLGKKINIVTYEQYNESKLNGLYPTKFIQAKVLYLEGESLGDKNDFNDLAVLQIDSKYASKHYVKLTSKKQNRGDEVYSIGMPYGVPFVLSHGIIASDNYLKGKQTHNIANIFIAPGSSGGPLFNVDGELIGIANIAFMFSKEGQSNLGLYLVSNKIKEYINIIKYDN